MKPQHTVFLLAAVMTMGAYEGCGPHDASFKTDDKPIRHTLVVNNNNILKDGLSSFMPQDANKNSGTDPLNFVYTPVLSPENTDLGLLSRLLLAEVRGPGSSDYVAADSIKGMSAIRSILENIKKCPAKFGALSASLHDVITAKNQFAGFERGAKPKAIQDVKEVIDSKLNPPGNTQKYKAYWEAMFNITQNSTVNDPFGSITKIGNKSVEPGTWGVRTTTKGTPGTNYVLLPRGNDLAGQDFFTIETGLIEHATRANLCFPRS
ncbi:MAG TPA: hypothetical protein VN666_08140 [Nitrospira sp.]|nr:hypothetical protein [Nitrospira sp.]